MADAQSDHDLLIELKVEIRHLVDTIKDGARDAVAFKLEIEKKLNDQRDETDSLKYFKAKVVGMSLALSVASSMLMRLVFK